jgi:hypothetical protein
LAARGGKERAVANILRCIKSLFIAVVKKTFQFRGASFATTAYAAILFADRNNAKRYKMLTHGTYTALLRLSRHSPELIKERQRIGFCFSRPLYRRLLMRLTP